MTTYTPRALYHLVRRAGCAWTPAVHHIEPAPQRAAQGREWTVPARLRQPVCNTNSITGAARAVLGGRLPRGCGPTIERMAEAIARRRWARVRPVADPHSRAAIHQGLLDAEAVRAGLPQNARLRGRLSRRLAAKVRAEAERRGLPGAVDLARAGDLPLSWQDGKRDGGRWTILLRAEGRAEYAKSYGYSPFKSLAILGGWDDAGMWAVRVPGTITTVADALAWLEPAAVYDARREGRRVLRQGDIWIVERARKDAMASTRLPANHYWDQSARVLRHPEHGAVHVPFPALPIPQRTLEPTGAGRRAGD